MPIGASTEPFFSQSQEYSPPRPELSIKLSKTSNNISKKEEEHVKTQKTQNKRKNRRSLTKNKKQNNRIVIMGANSATLLEVITPKRLWPCEQNPEPQSPIWPSQEWPQELKELCMEFDDVLVEE